MKENILTCVYCGHEYPAGTPASGSEVLALTDHIRECRFHPMNKLKRDKEKLWKALSRIVGADTKELLEAMKDVINETNVDAEEKIIVITGIQALLDTME